MKVLVTGAAGFIGFHLVVRLLERGDSVIGIDNINDYYSVELKYARLEQCGIAREKILPKQPTASCRYPNYRFYLIDLLEADDLESLCAQEHFDRVVHLAAQAGVRYSMERPLAYIDSNIVGFTHLLEALRHYPVEHFVYASSSSVYGDNTKVPFAEEDPVDHPNSLYAATKKSNELIAHTYSHLYGIPSTGIRFFTVYGPWGRPDMALMLFTRAILAGEPIQVFNQGQLSRDFTYIDDIIEGVVRILDKAPSRDGHTPADIYNIGCGQPVSLMEFIRTLERLLGRSAELVFLPMQPGDVYTTYADTSKLARHFDYAPRISIEEGIRYFVDWYRSFYL